MDVAVVPYRYKVIDKARSLLGVRVTPHGRTPSGIDCAGLLFLVFGDLGVEDFHDYDDKPTSALVYRNISRYADRIRGTEALPGDIVLLNFGGGSTHFALLTGDGTVVVPDRRRGEVVEVPLGTARAVAYFKMRGID